MFPINFNFPFRKKDGSISTIGDEISSGGGGSYELPTASAETKGGIKIGSGFSMDGEVLNNSNPTPYSLPTASAETLGGVKVGSGLSITDGVLSASGGSGGSLKYSEIAAPTYYNNEAITLTDDALVTFHAMQTNGGFVINNTNIFPTWSSTNQDVVYLLKKGDVVNVVSQCKFMISYLNRT